MKYKIKDRTDKTASMPIPIPRAVNAESKARPITEDIPTYESRIRGSRYTAAIPVNMPRKRNERKQSIAVQIKPCAFLILQTNTRTRRVYELFTYL